jgi:hypothetical protein
MAKKRTPKTIKTVKVSNLMRALSVEELRDQVKELRAEMTRYIIESIAVSILGLLLFIGAPSVFPTIIDPYNPNSLKIMQGVIAIPTVFWVLTVLGNMVRYFKILRLKAQLRNQK